MAKTDHQVAIRNIPAIRSPGAGGAAGPGALNLQGQWKKLDGNYQISITTAGEERDLTAMVDRDRLSVTGPGMNLFFSRQD